MEVGGGEGEVMLGKRLRVGWGGLGWNIPSPSYMGVLLLIFLFTMEISHCNTDSAKHTLPLT